MTTKQLNFKSLPELAVNDNATSPNLGVKGKGSIVYSTTLNKALMWDGTKWSSAGLKGDTGASGATASVATTSANGLMASTDKAKLDGIVTANLLSRANHTGEQAISSVTGLQAALDTKASTAHTHANATTAVAGFMSSTDKIKLDGVATSATAYVHPANHPASVITQDASNRFVTDAEKTTWNAKQNAGSYALDGHAHTAVTTSVAGFMSSADKTKLDGVQAGANNYAHPANHPASVITQDASNRFVTDAEKVTWNDKLGSVKTINGQSIVGSGDITISNEVSDTFDSSIFTNGLFPNNDSDSDIGSSGRKWRWINAQTFSTGTDEIISSDFGSRVKIAFGANWTELNFGINGVSKMTLRQTGLLVGATWELTRARAVLDVNGGNALINDVTVGKGAGLGYDPIMLQYMPAGTIVVNKNTAVGQDALANNTSGNYNTAVGFNTLKSNSDGTFNTAFGDSALTNNTSGGGNTAVGQDALASNTVGRGNTAVGPRTLYSNLSGDTNLAIGPNALMNNTTGSANICIGSTTSDGQPSPVFDVTSENNRVIMGSTAVTNAYIKVAWTVVSDARDKTNFAPVPHGLEFVKQLKPTAYQFRESRESEATNGGVRYGFKAQDIAAIEPEAVIVDTTNPEKFYYNESNLIAVLVKAVQELTAKVERLENASIHP